MWRDPIIEEVRAIRREIEDECGNDWNTLFEYYRKAQRKWSRTHRVVRAPGGKRHRAARAGK